MEWEGNLLGRTLFSGTPTGRPMPRIEPFEQHPDRYDRWFDRHPHVFAAEVRALRALMPGTGDGLEIGVGTGRFARELGIEEGIGPSPIMRRRARDPLTIERMDPFQAPRSFGSVFQRRNWIGPRARSDGRNQWQCVASVVSGGRWKGGRGIRARVVPSRLVRRPRAGTEPRTPRRDRARHHATWPGSWRGRPAERARAGGAYFGRDGFRHSACTSPASNGCVACLFAMNLC